IKRQILGQAIDKQVFEPHGVNHSFIQRRHYSLHDAVGQPCANPLVGLEKLFKKVLARLQVAP
ncbi:MAG: hypothetical protein V4749_13480, partial [Pseudomonadota bacterium]